MMGAGWVVNVIAAEWVIQRGRTHARSREVGGHPGVKSLAV
jgi:hypothetical protein